jgi:uncharacterized membrane protein YgdD (TMEM256/DUF423 family)
MARVAHRDAPGGKFWLGLAGALLAFGVGLFLCFVVFDRAVYRWGALGALVALGGVMILIGWIYDRREIRRYEALP